MNRPLGCFTGTALIASLFTVIVSVSAAFITSNGIFNPGGLNAEAGNRPLGGVWNHAELSGDCGSCHTPFWGRERMADRCMDCHASVQKEVFSRSGLHREFEGIEKCNTCHPEHQGANAPLTEYDQLRSEHENLGFSLSGHRSNSVGDDFQCQDCHALSLTSFEADTCVTCHLELDPAHLTQHTLDYGEDCLACHDGVDRYGSDFNHQHTAFPLVGGHTDTACTDCHLNARTAEDLQAVPSACIACHQEEDIHEGRLGEECASCHSQDSWQDADFDHSLTAFPLIGGHTPLACEDCHVDRQWTNIPIACAACHQKDDVHEGRLGQDCESCHWATTWDDLIDPEFDHNRTRFRLTGGHADVLCQDCHLGGQVTGVSMACASCHQKDDVHQNRLGASCQSCHNTSNWKDATVDHSITRFPLRGAHKDVACEKCHINGQLSGIALTCAGCHRDDFHKGQLGKECQVCHNENSWRSTFDHQQSTYPLTGAHIQADCTACHVDGQYRGTSKVCFDCHQDDDSHGGLMGRFCSECHTTTAWSPATFNHDQTTFPLTGAHRNALCQSCHRNGDYSNTPRLCVECHYDRDVHNGEFGSDCGACHNTSSWGGTDFDHGTTGFPLTGKHQNATCVSCHPGGSYAGTPTSCVACHQSDDVHNGAFGTDCAACHTSSGWSGAGVDHSQTSFPLTGAHTQVACSSCHTDGQYQGTPTSCVACHGDDDVHGGSFGSNCASCHSTSSWREATFDHGQTTFPLTGAHQEVTCSNCHTDGTYQGTPTQCAACHAEPTYHAGLFGSDCAACHSTNAWTPASYNQRHNFPLDHKETNGRCTSCHPSTLDEYVCTNCHKHEPGKMADKHDEVNDYDVSNCAACHPDGKND